MADFELKTWQKGLIATIVVIVVVIIIYYVFGKASVAKVDATTDPSKGRPPFYSAQTYALIKQNNTPVWHEPSQDEWGGVCAAVTNGNTGTADACHKVINNVETWMGLCMGWFKGMNIAPNNNYYNVFKKDIDTYANSAGAMPSYLITVGEFVATQTTVA